MFSPRSKPHSDSAVKKEKCLDGINFTSNDDSSDNLISVNQKFLAVMDTSGGEGCFVVVPIDKTGKTDNSITKICAHERKLTSIKWNIFNPHEIASASEDATIKLWSVFDNNPSRCVSTLRGHKSTVVQLEWHPSASDVLLSVGLDMKCMVWNVRVESTSIEITTHSNIASVAWKPDGSSFVILWQDKTIRVVDPRNGVSLVRTKIEESSYSVDEVMFVNDNRLITVGRSRPTEIFLMLWNLEEGRLKLLKKEVINIKNGGSKQCEAHSTFIDHHRQFLHIFQKGDGYLRSYKLSNEEPYMTIKNDRVTSPYRAVAMMPGIGGLVAGRSEMARFYQVHSTKNICEVVSIVGPSYVGTSEPIECQGPICTADQWIQGHSSPQSSSPVSVSDTTKTIQSGASNRTSPMTTSSFIHLTFSSPKLNRRPSKDIHVENGHPPLKLFSQELTPRRNSTVNQLHYLYSEPCLPSSTPSSFLQSIRDLPKNKVKSPLYSGDENLDRDNNKMRVSHAFQNRAYTGALGSKNTPTNQNFSNGPAHLTEEFSSKYSIVTPAKKSSPYSKTHKSPNMSAVRLRRMKQKELMFKSSSSSSSTESLDAISRAEKWNDNPLYSQTPQRSKKHHPRPRSKGRPDNRRKHSTGQIMTRCSVVDFGPLDNALNDVINQQRNLSKSSVDLFEIVKKDELHKSLKNYPAANNIINNKSMPAKNTYQCFGDASSLSSPSFDKRNNQISFYNGQNFGSFHSTAYLNGSTHQNPVLNGYSDSGQYRSAFSVVKTSMNVPVSVPLRYPNSRLFNDIDTRNARLSLVGPKLNYDNNFYSTDHLTQVNNKYNDLDMAIMNLKSSSNIKAVPPLQRAMSLREDSFDGNSTFNGLSKPIPTKCFSAYKQHEINQSTPQLAASVGSMSSELLYSLNSLQSSLQTITEDDAKFQSLNDFYSSSSSLTSNSDRTLRSDHSTVNYELNSNCQRLSPQCIDRNKKSSISNKISHSFLFAVPASKLEVPNIAEMSKHNSVSQQVVFEKVSCQDDEIVKLRRQLTSKDVRIKMLEEQLKRVSACAGD